MPKKHNVSNGPKKIKKPGRNRDSTRTVELAMSKPSRQELPAAFSVSTSKKGVFDIPVNLAKDQRD